MSLPTILDTTSSDSQARTRRDRRASRYEARRTLWRETKLRRVAYCGRFLNGRSDGVQVKLSGVGNDAKAGFSGLQTCGNVWACPVCAEKIQAARQAELHLGLTRHLENGGGVEFVTFTVRHNKGHRLAELLDAISPAWQGVTSKSSAWRGTKKERGDKQRFGIAGFVRLLEIKVGEANGWHPHVHALLFTHRPLREEERRDLTARMFGRWEAGLAKHGFKVLESVGVDMRPVWSAAEISDYFAKHGYEPRKAASAGRAAYEVTSSQTKQAGKGGRTPFELLADMVAGEVVNEDTGELMPAPKDLRLWREYEKATKGRRQLTWSRGLREYLGLDAEKTDEELVEEDELGGVVLVELTGDQWSAGRWAWRAEELLRAAEDGSLFELLRGEWFNPGETRAARRRARRE